MARRRKKPGRLRDWLLLGTALLVVGAMVGFIIASRVTQARRNEALANFRALSASKAQQDALPRDDAPSPSAPASPPTEDAPPEEAQVGYEDLFAQFEEGWEADPTLAGERIYLLRLILQSDEAYEEHGAAIEAFVRANQDLIARIREEAAPGGLVCRPDTENGRYAAYRSLQDRTWKLGSLAGLLAISAMLSSQDGNADEAVENLIAGMSLADAMLDHPESGTLWAHHSVYGMVGSGLEALLARGPLTQEEASRLLARLDHAYERDACVSTFLANAERGLEMLQDARTLGGDALLEKYASGDKDQLGVRLVAGLLASPLAAPLVQTNEDALARQAVHAIELVEQPYYEVAPQMKRLFEEAINGPLTQRFARFSFFMDFWITLEYEQPNHEAEIDLMRMAIALEQHRDEHGTYPAALDAITGRLGGSLPVDPFSGEAYHYDSQGGSFQLQSFGFGSVDDEHEGPNHSWSSEGGRNRRGDAQ